MDFDNLLAAAKQAATMAYAPYSGYKVGAAALFKSGSVFTGCNVENASYGLTNCAERTAIFKAVSQGERELLALAVYVEAKEFFPPCGACRQVIAEFGSEVAIIYACQTGEKKITSIKELLPQSFKL